MELLSNLLKYLDSEKNSNIICYKLTSLEGNVKKSKKSMKIDEHCIKNARIQAFIDPYSPRFCPYTGEYGSVKTRILVYFM